MKMLLDGKIAIITGGSQGFGLTMAEEFTKEGATVVIVNRTKDKGVEAVEKINKTGGQAVAIPCNTSEMDQVREMVTRVKEMFGRIDILVNNAGIIKPMMIYKMTREIWDEVLKINLTGYFNCMRCVCDVMIPQNYGRMLNISSVAGQRGGTLGQANYAAAKAGVHGLTKSAARELARYSITVNTIAAGLFETAMSSKMPEDMKQKAIEEIPLKRMGESWELAKLAAFLVSDNAAYITGQIIGLNGGVYM
jgi:NAD(P)-dependent dehydrogenase (short-subunit alcohol dehydrogenase family)